VTNEQAQSRTPRAVRLGGVPCASAHDDTPRARCAGGNGTLCSGLNGHITGLQKRLRLQRTKGGPLRLQDSGCFWGGRVPTRLAAARRLNTAPSIGPRIGPAPLPTLLEEPPTSDPIASHPRPPAGGPVRINSTGTRFGATESRGDETRATACRIAARLVDGPFVTLPGSPIRTKVYRPTGRVSAWPYLPSVCR
jgi:hypothetical protein